MTEQIKKDRIDHDKKLKEAILKLKEDVHDLYLF